MVKHCTHHQQEPTKNEAMNQQLPSYQPAKPFSASFEGYAATAADWPNTVTVEADSSDLGRAVGSAAGLVAFQHPIGCGTETLNNSASSTTVCLPALCSSTRRPHGLAVGVPLYGHTRHGPDDRARAAWPSTRMCCTSSPTRRSFPRHPVRSERSWSTSTTNCPNPTPALRGGSGGQPTGRPSSAAATPRPAQVASTRSIGHLSANTSTAAIAVIAAATGWTLPRSGRAICTGPY